MIIPARVESMFYHDLRIVEVRHYVDGYVPRSYRWDAYGKAEVYRRGADGSIEYVGTKTYSRLRRYGKGPEYVGLSAAGGRLASV